MSGGSVAAARFAVQRTGSGAMQAEGGRVLGSLQIIVVKVFLINAVARSIIS